ncbi:putative ATP-dependent DNA helicase PIF1 [Rhizoctonia solani 123E]|uniref:ATP-dependent DNA helicase n=1 Tax=Rhizoctonia solani 123E TaxID=1423351 RepID=A0A074RGM9_9AGAM|nr:putative ATP-dependent DNA helicase PIF1 [Rhizoctonia solani 123E]
MQQLALAGRHDLGGMDVRCQSCGAWHWMAEKLISPRGAPRNAIIFGSCCVRGQIQLPPPKCPPRELWELYTRVHVLSENFHKNIRAINASLAFTSFGATRLSEQPAGQGPLIFKVGGEIHHRSGMLDRLPEGQQPQYAQLYLYDPEDATRHRMNNPHNAGIDRQLMRLLTGVLQQSHGYAALYKHAWQMMLDEQNVPTLSIVLRQQRNRDPRRYNLPTSDEIALIVPDNALNHQRDIVLFKQAGGFQKMDSWNPAYACLHYVLLFPKGEHGFQRHIPIEGANQRQSRRSVSEREYYAFYLFSREEQDAQVIYPGPDGVFSTLFRGGRLFHQYLVDIWAVIDQSHLLYLRNNQSSLRVELYSGLCDALLNDNLTRGEQVGRVILPASYYGGPRQMAESYQDAMAIARYLGGPQLFITMTANPKWPEIQNALLPEQSPSDRPDLIIRVFELKRRQLMDDIKKGVFGKCIAHVHTIEFQKRGLPHMHLLVWLERASHILESADVDELISAEIPIAEGEGADPLLYTTVVNSMLHGPCGPEYPNAACWDSERRVCTKGFYPQKQWTEHTIMVNDSYPQYRRRNNGQTVQKTINGRQVIFDNRHVVPYNPFLSRKYNCHINVETCSGIGAIKYIFKYVYKGGDRITIEIVQNIDGEPRQGPNPDEISAHLDARWISPYEALWRLFKFTMHAEVPNIVRLQVHLPNQQSVSFRQGELIENVVANAKDTTLTAFFKLNSHENAETKRYANELVYQEIPSRFTWQKASRKWKLRRLIRNNDGSVKFTAGALGRMYFAPPNSGERFYLRTLLTVVRGPTSFEDLRTYNGVVFGTFKEACIAQGLLESDDEWAQCLTEAAQFKTGQQMRRLFVVILTACTPSKPDELWTRFRAQICDDLRYKLSREPWNCPNPTDDEVYDFGLYLIEILVHETGSNMRDCNMPTCTQNWDQINQEQNRLIREQYTLRDEQPVGMEYELQDQLTDEQREAFNKVLDSVNNDWGTTFFLDGPAGTGKTFLYRTLCYTLRAQDKIVLCVASSGLAALLLPGGKTSHSVFKIPIDVKDNSTCNIPKRSHLAALIARTDLIIWDEVPMQDRFCVEAFNRTCTDIGRHPDRPFGGITIVFGGDFRQTLPVVPKGTPEQIIAQCLKESPLWGGMQKLRLSRNMRLQGDPEMAEFATWLLEVGEGHQIPQGNNFVDIAFKPSMRVASRDALIDKIYGDLSNPHHVNDEYLRGRTILTPRNDDVIILNKKILTRFTGQSQVFQSADKVIYEAGVDDERLGTLSTEYLNSLNSGSVPLSKLELKVGCPVMVLRNLARAQGVCNGTRGVVTHMGSRVLELRLLTGSEAGKTVFIPRISITPPETEFGFQLSRRQFPVRLAFAMTINKSQGQSVDHVGLDLEREVFSHGQLYVAFSRCTSASRVYVFNKKETPKTRNVVFKSVFRH